MNTTAGPFALDPCALPSSLLLNAEAARSCPVKTQYRFEAPPGRLEGSGPCTGSGARRDEPHLRHAPEQISVAERDPRTIRAGVAAARRAALLDSLLDQAPGSVVDLRLLAHEPDDSRRAATVAAVADGAEVIVAPVLPVDPDGHRRSSPDLLVRGADTSRGPTYHPVAVRGHAVIELAPPADPGPETAEVTAVRFSTLSRPRPIRFEQRPGLTFRPARRHRDLRELAHHHRTLQSAGWAGTPAWAGLLGPDPSHGPAVLVWVDLAEPAPLHRLPAEADGHKTTTVLADYDHAFARRLDIARAAAAGCPPLLEPVVVRECQTCPWWERCLDRLDPDDISLRIDRGALDRSEIERLRGLGVRTVTALAAADLDQLLPAYLPALVHRGQAEPRLRTAQRRAQMLRAGVDFVREDPGPVSLPRAVVEVDLDLESAADGRTYLWGFWVEHVAQPDSGRYVSFGRFTDLDDAAETALAVQALNWLRALVTDEPSVRVYHYSGYEVGRIQALAARDSHPTLRWAAHYASTQFVDLLQIVQQHYFGVHGLGLKLIAGHAGFDWRDDDPGGLNSQRWFADAAHAPREQTRIAARQRILNYNEDDVRATRYLRRWLASR